MSSLHHSSKYIVYDSDFNSPMKTGGEKTHTLTIAEIPKHYHPFKSVLDNQTDSGGALPKGASASGNNRGWSSNTPGNGEVNCPVRSQGGSGSHNNLQPYYCCYIFRRTN